MPCYALIFKFQIKNMQRMKGDPLSVAPVDWDGPDHPSNRLPDAQHAADGRVLTVFSVAAVEVALMRACDRFEQDSLWQVCVRFNTTPELMNKLRHGLRADVWIAPPSLLAQAERATVVGPYLPLAQVGVGVAIPAGQALPDVSTTQAWVQALRSATSIFYTQASSGQYVHGLLSSMGLLAQTHHKVRRFENGEDMLVALSQLGHQHGAMAMGAISEIRTFSHRGLVFAGPLPEAIGHRTTYAVATDPISPRAAHAHDWVQICKHPDIWGDAACTGIEPI